MQDSLLAALRRDTAGQHARLEQLLRLEEPFGIVRYTAVLQGFEAFLRDWEPHVERALPADLAGWFRGRRRRAMAHADLSALGAAPLSASAALPALRSTHEALGSLYVLEGSALGGQVIARQVRAQHGFTGASGAAYFNGWGERTGAMWREFQQVLARYDEPARHGAVADGAARTFGALIDWFAEVPHAAA